MINQIRFGKFYYNDLNSTTNAKQVLRGFESSRLILESQEIIANFQKKSQLQNSLPLQNSTCVACHDGISSPTPLGMVEGQEKIETPQEKKRAALRLELQTLTAEIKLLCQKSKIGYLPPIRDISVLKECEKNRINKSNEPKGASIQTKKIIYSSIIAGGIAGMVACGFLFWPIAIYFGLILMIVVCCFTNELRKVCNE